MLIAIFAVLLVVLMFFQGAFREIGTESFKEFATSATNSQGEEKRIGGLLGEIGSWFGSPRVCTSDDDCTAPYTCERVDKCLATRKVEQGIEPPGGRGTYCYYVYYADKGWGPYYPGNECNDECSAKCGSDKCAEMSDKMCIVK